MKDDTWVISEESTPSLSKIAPLHAKLVTSTEGSMDDTQTVKDIRAASAQDLGKRDASERKTLCLVSALDAKFKDLLFLSEAESSETSSSLIDAVVAAMKKLQNQQEEVDSPVEGKTRLRFVTHLTMKIALPSPPSHP